VDKPSSSTPWQEQLAAGSPELPKTTSTTGRLIQTIGSAAACGFILCIFEWCKHELFPNLGTLASQAATILAVTLLVTAISISLLKREKRRRHEMASKEMRYRLLFHKSLIGAYRATVDGRVLDCNVAFCRMLGYSAREELIGQSVDITYFNEGGRAGFIEQLQAEGEVTNYEERLRRKDGSVLWVLVSAALVTDEVGKGPVIKGTMTDITEQVNTQQENRRLSDIVRYSEDAIASVSMTGMIQTWNAGAERMSGYSAAEVLGKPISIITPPDQADDTAEILERLKRECRIENRELVRVRKDGQRVTLQLSVSPITDREGNIVGASTIARDITDKKHTEAALQQSEEQYRMLFEGNAIAMWVYDRKTLRYLAVNEAAIKQYGYSREEFLTMKLPDIRLAEDVPALLQEVAKEKPGVHNAGIWRHRRKDGTILSVEIISHDLIFDGTDANLVAAYDVTERKRSEVVMRQSEEQYRLLFESNPTAMYVYDRRTLGILAVNKAAIEQYGYSEQEFLAKTIADIRPAEDIPQLLQDVAAHTSGLQKRGIWRHRRRNGSNFDVEIVCHGLDFHGTNSILVAAHDVTERKRAEDAVKQAEAKYRGIFENAVVGIFQSRPDGRFISVNRALANMHGYESPEALLADVSRAGPKLMVDPSGMAKLAEEAEVRGAVRGAELEIYRKDGTRRWVRINLRVIRDASGKVVLREGTVEDITEHKAAQERVQFLAFYDALTELPQRALLKDRLEIAMAGARRRHEKIALLFIDLDRFKAINDGFGHSFGDVVLKEIAKRLKGCTRESNTLARIGGDEFIIMLCNLKDPADAVLAADQVMEAMNASFTIQGRSVNVGCSIGISIFPEHGTDGEIMIHNADVAMYAAKDSGRGNVRIFTDEMNAQTVERLTMDNDLRLAIDREEFSLVYQPQMDMEYGRITGFEALIRWKHPEIGMIPPGRFISIAENNGLILPIGEWVLRTACMQARRWQDEGLRAVPMAVNVSAVQFCQGGFLGLIRRVLQETGLAPEYMELEITESLLLSDEELTRSVLRELKTMGVKLSIDDFGTGYSCLSYLKHYPVDRLKIDQSFVRDCVADRDDAAITASIISMAHSLHLKVVAEGVEKESQMSFLRQHRCDEIQGYYFSKAIPANEAASLLQSETDFGQVGDGIAFEKLFWPTPANYSGRPH